MKKAEVKHGERVIFPRCEITTSALERMVGLLSRSSLGEGEALLIAPCPSVHTFFMRFAIDVAFLDRSGKIVALYESMRPWRHSWFHFTAASALEAPAGAFARAGLRKGEVLTLCPST